MNLSNNYLNILRVVTFIFRFFYNLKNTKSQTVGHLPAAELDEAEVFLVRIVQIIDFFTGLKSLSKVDIILPNRKLKCLIPSLDKQVLIKFVDRLHNTYQIFVGVAVELNKLFNLVKFSDELLAGYA